MRAPGWARAVEHTSLDSFGDQRGVAARFHRVIAPLEARLTGRVDHYIELAVDPKAIATGADWTAWTEAIGEAVVAAVPAMPIDEWGTLRVPGVPFEIGVRTEENAGIGEVRVIQMAPADLEGERAEVIREAISGKVGVLAPYKAHGYRTVLVLECDDLMLGSRRRIADAFRPLAAACGTAIDDVYLVETRTSPWAVSWLKLGDLVTLHPEPVWPTAPGWPFRLR